MWGRLKGQHKLDKTESVNMKKFLIKHQSSQADNEWLDSSPAQHWNKPSQLCLPIWAYLKGVV